MLRELLMILAAMPSELHTLPPAAPEGSSHLRFAWCFLRRCLRCLQWHRPPGGALPCEGLQLLFALLDVAVEMVASEHTRQQPERKRLALWASLCIAVRLAVEAKKMEEPGGGRKTTAITIAIAITTTIPTICYNLRYNIYIYVSIIKYLLPFSCPYDSYAHFTISLRWPAWLLEKMKLWGRFDDFVDLEGLACRVYVTRFAVNESWASDPVSGRRPCPKGSS